MKQFKKIQNRLKARRAASMVTGQNNSEKGVKTPGSQNRNKNYPNVPRKR